MILVSACFRRETRWIAPRAGVRVVHTAMGEAAAAGLDRALLRGESVTALVSTGFCAGLDPTLESGDLFLAESVRYRGETIHVAPALFTRARAAVGSGAWRVRTGLCESAAGVLDAGEKKRLFAEGAIAADMESGPIVRWAGRHSTPVLICRVVLDPAGMQIPFSEDRPFWVSVLRHPAATARLARQSQQAGQQLGAALGAVLETLEVGP